ncbi:MAG: hypothetical protein M1479_00845 [Actinobacteria bacterium]|nr:hypothetical protein [Cyanobacteriota bacterium]MCL5770810.1 hypothetical protein [Actinomycetota bacterium]
MKAKLIPLYFKSGKDEDFEKQLQNLRNLLVDYAEIQDSIPIGKNIPDVDAVIFPQLLGDAFKQINEIKKIKVPIIIATSDFGTVNMWDWEIVAFMQSEGIKVFAPYNSELTKKICKSLALKKEMEKTKFLVFQDNPGTGGMQAEIFKRFYWWEDQYINRVKDKFGISLIKKSFKELGSKAKEIPDSEARKILKNLNIKIEDVSERALNSAIKIYIAVKEEIGKDSEIKGVGINCLNESFYSDTTPCLAWNLLYEEKKIMWACEADISSLLTNYIINKSLDAPAMMSNIYPFLMGLAALKHEKIDKFPEVKDPQNYSLIVHCGYFGVVPQSFCSSWVLKPKVLAIVDDNATAIDARMPEGDITLTKLDPTLTKLMAVEGIIERYVQYPGTDCRNGALVKVANGYKLMNAFYSHHNCIVEGKRLVEIENIISKVFDIQITGI